MTRIILTLAVSATAFGLTACGSEPTEPVEQIVVREPGQAVTTAVEPSASDGVDLVTAGEAAFAACAACHSVDAGAPSGAGPNLYGVVDRAAGALDDFSYSEALAGSGITWNVQELDAFLTNPQTKIPGTTMVAGAVSDAGEREAIIAYLGSLSE